MLSKNGKLIVFSAPSGAGKTTIVRHLLEQPDLNLEFSISATSRAKRGQEKHGEDYYFLSKEAFKHKINEHAFIEWEEVYKDNFYGTLKTEIYRIWSKGKHIIFDIDAYGGLKIKEKFPENTIAIFVKPPSIDALKERLKKRNTDTEETINMRLKKASLELSKSTHFDITIVNENLNDTLQQAYGIVKTFINKSM